MISPNPYLIPVLFPTIPNQSQPLHLPLSFSSPNKRIYPIPTYSKECIYSFLPPSTLSPHVYHLEPTSHAYPGTNSHSSSPKLNIFQSPVPLIDHISQFLSHPYLPLPYVYLLPLSSYTAQHTPFPSCPINPFTKRQVNTSITNSRTV